MSYLPFEITSYTFSPNWEETGKKRRLGELGWRKTTMNDYAPDLLVATWVMRRLGRPSKPVTSTFKTNGEPTATVLPGVR